MIQVYHHAHNSTLFYQYHTIWWLYDIETRYLCVFALKREVFSMFSRGHHFVVQTACV